ncbi:hypothetical protein TIFTF001_029923 [Ficus carica]|uniref:Uncharacterized protein n=1 Tax=Ficus carica TaxID=3494 RepID=A0AA88DSH1_FICCA|nr:hypothetical protein TIFTF001_029923 [Ficus carica]
MRRAIPVGYLKKPCINRLTSELAPDDSQLSDNLDNRKNLEHIPLGRNYSTISGKRLNYEPSASRQGVTCKFKAPTFKASTYGASKASNREVKENRSPYLLRLVFPHRVSSDTSKLQEQPLSVVESPGIGRGPFKQGNTLHSSPWADAGCCRCQPDKLMPISISMPTGVDVGN